MRNPANGEWVNLTKPKYPHADFGRFAKAQETLVASVPHEGDTPGAARKGAVALFERLGVDGDVCMMWIDQQAEEDIERLRSLSESGQPSAMILQASLQVAYTVGLAVGMLLGAGKEGKL